jgi:hypothetical protein
MVLQAEATTRIHDMAGVLEVQHTFRRYYAITAALAALGSAGWWWLWIRATIPRWAFALLGTLTVGELLWFGYGRAAQTDPALYYPRIPVLEQLATAPPGRIIGFNCLPANLAQTHGLHDVRGYDGVDPAQWVNLLKAAADPKSYMPRYALTQWLSPKGEVLPSGRLVYSPILSMLDVRYIVLRGRPAPGVRPALQDVDYFVLENREALPRVFVPQRVETVEDQEERLRRLSAVNFDPRQIAYVERPVGLPAVCQGSASIIEETPQRVTVAANMRTAGLVVLADRWDQGWKAYLDGKETPILRTNHALRGVVLPAGEGILQFRFEPAALARGTALSGLALLAWTAWAAAVAWRRRGHNADESGTWPPLHMAATPQGNRAQRKTGRH